MGTAIKSPSQLVCPFCGHTEPANDARVLVRPVHQRQDYAQIYRCRGCQLLFAPKEDAEQLEHNILYPLTSE
jgi:hypothetical protein